VTYERGVLLDGVPEDAYHADPALSSTQARLLVPPSTPAHYRWVRDHGRPPKPAYDLGHLVHSAVLGVGAGMVEIEGNRNRSDVKAAIAEAREAGQIPVKPEEAELVGGAVAAVRAHPLDARLPADGVPEQSGWWTDPETGIDCRFRTDWLTTDGAGVVAVDLKTVGKEFGASLQLFSKSVGSYRYHGQADHYLTGLAACGLTDVAWVWVVVELDPPYLVAVHDLDADALALAATTNATARRLLANCIETNEWPGYGDQVTTVTLPRYVTT